MKKREKVSKKKESKHLSVVPHVIGEVNHAQSTMQCIVIICFPPLIVGTSKP